jgi:hypothetical protein
MERQQQKQEEEKEEELQKELNGGNLNERDGEQDDV